jgi:hypothetical protein
MLQVGGLLHHVLASQLITAPLQHLIRSLAAL